MKAKDIALLCTAAAGAGAAAGAAVSSTAGKNAKAVKTQPKKKTAPAAAAAKKPPRHEPAENTIPSKAELTKVSGIIGSIEKISCENDCGIVTVITAFERTHRAFTVKNGTVSELRCPVNVIAMASDNDTTVFLTSKGGIFVYADSEREPVLCPITAPEYVCAVKGNFCIFSDSLMYLCGSDGNIIKTVSLGAMIEITGSDICDAENSDDNFAAISVTIKKSYPIKDSSFMAVLTEDGRTFLTDCLTDGFTDFEKTYSSIIDICAYGSFAYYLCSTPEGYALIKARVTEDSFQTEAKYALCPKEDKPEKLHSCEYGIIVLFSTGKLRFLLPEIPDGMEKEHCRSALRTLNTAFSDVQVSDIFTINGKAAVYDGSSITYADVVFDE